jgi:hypothetical protein
MQDTLKRELQPGSQAMTIDAILAVHETRLDSHDVDLRRLSQKINTHKHSDCNLHAQRLTSIEEGIREARRNRLWLIALLVSSAVQIISSWF